MNPPTLLSIIETAFAEHYSSLTLDKKTRAREMWEEHASVFDKNDAFAAHLGQIKSSVANQTAQSNDTDQMKSSAASQTAQNNPLDDVDQIKEGIKCLLKRISSTTTKPIALDLEPIITDIYKKESVRLFSTIASAEKTIAARRTFGQIDLIVDISTPMFVITTNMNTILMLREKSKVNYLAMDKYLIMPVIDCNEAAITFVREKLHHSI